MITNKLQRGLIRSAFRKFGEIKPIGAARSFCDSRCFSRGVGKVYEGKLMFWFETPDGSSHLVTEELNAKAN